MATKLREGTPIEVREYIQACDEWFVHAGPETPREVEHIYIVNYAGAWGRLLEAGYTPNDTDAYRA